MTFITYGYKNFDDSSLSCILHSFRTPLDNIFISAKYHKGNAR